MLTTAIGTAYSAQRGISDIGYNIVNGALSFVKGYTSDLGEALIPPADQLVGE